MKMGVALLLAVSAVADARAQPSPPAQQQGGVGPTGTMYDGNNLARFPLARPPAANPPGIAGGVTGAQGSGTEGGSGAGGGEH